MGSLQQLLTRLREQLQETEEALKPIEQELSSRTLSPARREALRRRQGRLLHQRQLQSELIARLIEQTGTQQ